MNVEPQPDRRSMPRYPVDAEATVVLVNHGPSLRGRIVELSVDGCRLRTDKFCALAAPASIEVMFKLNGVDFRLGGIMQWVEPRQMAGIQFSPMAARRRDFLVELLAELEAGTGKAEVPAPTGESQPASDNSGQPCDASVSGMAEPPKAAIVATADPAPERAPVEPVPPVAPASRRERRSQERHWVDSRAIIYFVDVRAKIAGRILDVSLGGCRIRTDERFPVGIYRRVEAEFTFDGLAFRLAGVVQSLHDKFTVGIRFLDMSARKRDQLIDLIAEIDETLGRGPCDQGA